MLIGYARVSSVGQSLDIQVEALTAAGYEKIYGEKRSGRTAQDRPELGRALDQLRHGDQLVVTRLDRLARSVGDLHRLVEQITASGAAFRCLQQGGVDTTTSTGKLMLAILGAVSDRSVPRDQPCKRLSHHALGSLNRPAGSCPARSRHRLTQASYLCIGLAVLGVVLVVERGQLFHACRTASR